VVTRALFFGLPAERKGEFEQEQREETEVILNIVMPHVGFYTLGCTNCRQVFDLPSLGDMNYGEILLHGERGTVHRYVCVLDHPVWTVIDAVFSPQEPEGSRRWWRASAAAADPVDGQRLQVEPVCPHCQADSGCFRTPKWASKTPRRGEVDNATFNAFLALPSDEQRRRIAVVSVG
jgi:hypothetical protein